MSLSDAHILAAVKSHGSQRKAAAALGIHSRTLERRMARMDGKPHSKLLVIDIETRPLTVYTWGLWQQNIGINQIIDHGGIMCFAAKWHGEDETVFYSERQGREKMLRAAHRLLSEADAVVGWNSQRFDVRWLGAEFKREGLPRVAGIKHVDLMRSVKRHQYLPSYKMDYSARNLGVGGKVQTGGFQLWRDCMAGNKAAWALMEEYNRADTNLTDEILLEMMNGGWIHGLPNLSLDHGDVCPDCGSDKLQADGYHDTKTRRYPRWKCGACGSTSQSVRSEPGSATRKAVA